MQCWGHEKEEGTAPLYVGGFVLLSKSPLFARN